jgi:hypothetical protein
MELLLLLLAALFVVYLISRKRGNDWRQLLTGLAIFAAVAIGLPLLVVLLVVPTRTVTHRVAARVAERVAGHPTERVEIRMARAVPGTAGLARDGVEHLISGGSEWLPEVEETHSADVYCSPGRAARELGRQIARTLDEPRQRIPQTAQALDDTDATTDIGPVTIRLDVPDPAATTSIYLPLAAAIRQHRPGSVVTEAVETLAPDSGRNDAEGGNSEGDAGEPSGGAGDVAVSVSMPRRQTRTAPWNPDEQEESGELLARVSWSGQQHAFTARFVHKPWVDDFSAFRSQHPDFLQARGEDGSDALRRAAAALWPRVAPHLPAPTPAAKPIWRSEEVWFSDEVLRPLLRQIREEALVTDRFAQAFHTDVDGVAMPAWSREAILVDCSSPKLAQLARGMEREFRGQQTRRVNWLVRTGGLLGLICVVYLGLNAATKGYYTGVLRVTAALLMAGVLLLLGGLFW